jgi:hypothetical protein
MLLATIDAAHSLMPCQVPALDLRFEKMQLVYQRRN